MPHQCTTCGKVFPDGSKEMLSGCPSCGGNKFQFKPEGADVSETPDAEPPEPPGPDSTVARTVGKTAASVRDFVVAPRRTGTVPPSSPISTPTGRLMHSRVTHPTRPARRRPNPTVRLRLRIQPRPVPAVILSSQTNSHPTRRLRPNLNTSTARRRRPRPTGGTCPGRAARPGPASRGAQRPVRDIKISTRAVRTQPHGAVRPRGVHHRAAEDGHYSIRSRTPSAPSDRHGHLGAFCDSPIPDYPVEPLHTALCINASTTRSICRERFE